MVSRHITLARAVRALGALGHETRLNVHRLLVLAGDEGLSAGFIAHKLGLPASSLSFHLTHMQNADLITQRRVGTSLFYAVNFDCMDRLVAYLHENCCQGVDGKDCEVGSPEPTGEGAREKEKVSL